MRWIQRIKARFVFVITALMLMFGSINTAWGHHSFSVFNAEITQTLSGEVVEFEWTNPHTWLWLNVRNEDGSVIKWGLEGMSPNYLGRRGWSKRSLQAGDKIIINIFPLKSGEAGGMLTRATLDDGTILEMFDVGVFDQTSSEEVDKGNE